MEQGEAKDKRRQEEFKKEKERLWTVEAGGRESGCSGRQQETRGG